MDANQSLVTKKELAGVVTLVMAAVNSPHTQRVYKKALDDFLAWWVNHRRPVLNKHLVNLYRVELEHSGLAPATINQRLSAIRKLAQEAADNGLIPQDIANGVSRAQGVKMSGVRAGKWLTKDQAQLLLNTPDITTIKGLRDRAILAVLLGGGLRREEVAGLTFEHIRQVDGRWAIVNLTGKRGRVRTVPIPAWCKAAIDAWSEAAHLSSGHVFRGVYHYGKTLQAGSESITPQAVFYAVKAHIVKLGWDISPHDLRRTFAKLARKGGAELTQIQLVLGHSSVKVTQDYIGEDLNLTDAPCDRIGLSLSGD